MNYYLVKYTAYLAALLFATITYFYLCIATGGWFSFCCMTLFAVSIATTRSCIRIIKEEINERKKPLVS